VYPASFEYFAPTTLDEALSTLERFGDEAKVLAGGQVRGLRDAERAAVRDAAR
jgi:CO/xanthine dehydrogenase FAD-binding subunit